MGHASQQLVFHSTCVQTHDFSRGGPALGSPRRGQNHAFARRYSDSALSHQLSVTKLLSVYTFNQLLLTAISFDIVAQLADVPLLLSNN